MYRKLPGGHFRALKNLWLEFVRDQKENEGGQRYLPKAKRCHCGKSLTSYPHWPPSTYEEAVAQLQSLIRQGCSADIIDWLWSRGLQSSRPNCQYNYLTSPSNLDFFFPFLSLLTSINLLYTVLHSPFVSVVMATQTSSLCSKCHSPHTDSTYKYVKQMYIFSLGPVQLFILSKFNKLFGQLCKKSLKKPEKNWILKSLKVCLLLGPC